MVLLLWLALVLAGAAVIARTPFSADLSAFLPASPDARQRVLIEQLQSGVASRTLMAGVEGGTGPVQRADIARALGKAMRATAQDPEAARMMGIRIDLIILLTFFIGSALAGAAAVIFGLYYGLTSYIVGYLVGLRAFTAAVLGGIGSLPGAVLGGLLIGLIETFWSAYFSVQYKDVAAFGILVLTLVFLPTGLLGRQEVEKV